MIEELIKLILILILILAGLFYLLIPKSKFSKRLKMNESVFIFTNLIGIICGAIGLVIIFIYPKTAIELHLWEIIVIPFVLINVLWLTIIRIKRTSEILDEKQELDMMKSAAVTLGLSIITMGFVIFPLFENELIDGKALFPCYLLINVLFYSMSTLYFFKRK
jgi:hypothetical protein